MLLYLHHGGGTMWCIYENSQPAVRKKVNFTECKFGNVYVAQKHQAGRKGLSPRTAVAFEFIQ